MKIALWKTPPKNDDLLSVLAAYLIDLCSGSKGVWHAELIFSDDEAFTSFMTGGSQFVNREHPLDQWVVFDIGNYDQEGIARNWCLNHVGHPYDWRGIFRFLFNGGEKDQDADRYFCSEIVVIALQQIGLFKDKSSWKASPNTLMGWCDSARMKRL